MTLDSLKTLGVAVVATSALAAFSTTASATSVTHTWHFDEVSVCGGSVYKDRYGRKQCSEQGSDGAVDAADSKDGAYMYDSDKGMTTMVSGWYDDDGLENGDEYLKHWSGLSMDRPGENVPWHGIDNDGPDEFVVFKFDEAISLEHFKLGYARQSSKNGSAYADVTILYRDPAKANSGVGPLQGEDIEDITNTSLGYNVLGHWDNIAQGANFDISSLTDGIVSKVWAIGTYIKALKDEGLKFGTPETGSYNDAFKLKSISGSTDHVAVPAPASSLLLLIGLYFAARRRATA